MSRELLILRHSKSDWAAGGLSDHERPLNTRGQHDAMQLAGWLKNKSLKPDSIICSTALRAKQTVQPIIEQLGLDAHDVCYEEKLYLASLKQLLRLLGSISQGEDRVMIVGHNPGLDELVSYLTADASAFTHNGKLMTTTCLAHFKMPTDWQDLNHRAELISITRPGDIAE